MEKEGVVEFLPNPNHKRAHLVVLTEKGQKLFEEALAPQKPWVNGLSDGLTPDEISATKSVVDLLTRRLEEELETAT